MINNVSRRVLRLMAKQKVERKVTVDHFKDLQAALSPLVIQSQKNLSEMDDTMRELIKTKFSISQKDLVRNAHQQNTQH